MRENEQARNHDWGSPDSRCCRRPSGAFVRGRFRPRPLCDRPVSPRVDCSHGSVVPGGQAVAPTKSLHVPQRALVPGESPNTLRRTGSVQCPHPARTNWVTVTAILRRADRIPIGDCCVTARTKTSVLKELALALSLLVLAGTSGGLGHAFPGGTWHRFETTIATAAGGPAEQNPLAPASSHVATDCPLCGVRRTSSAAPSVRITWFTGVGERSYAAFLPQISAPSSPPPRANAARAPPIRLSA